MDSSKSCWFVTVKYVLISILLVNFVNLMVALSSGISSEPEKNKQLEKEPLTTKKILETVRLVTTLISVIFGLVGVSRESFCLSVTTGIIMILETVASFFGQFDASTIVSMVFNTLIALTTFAFAYMCKAGMNVFNTAQIEPVMVARNRTASKCPSVVVNLTDESTTSPVSASTNDESTKDKEQREGDEKGPAKSFSPPPIPMQISEEPSPVSIPEPLPVAITEEPTPVSVLEEPTPVSVLEEPTPVSVLEEPTPVSVPEEPSPIPVQEDALTISIAENREPITITDEVSQVVADLPYSNEEAMSKVKNDMDQNPPPEN